ncbi:MAG: META domain-containing protein [Prevotella sp.]|nr:META domain-containing protein [Prevotella sp.]
MKKKMIVAAAVAALFTACASTQRATSPDALVGEWTIERIHGTAIDKKAGEQIPFLGFDRENKRIYGHSGCNRLSCGWDVQAGTLDTKLMASTRMMCADMTNETKVLQALNEVEKYHIEKNGTLVLTDSKGKAVIELEKRQK